MKRRAGFTLVELMVSTAILGIVVMLLLRTFTVQHKTYTVVDQVTEMQQTARAVADLIEHDLRHAGMMVPESGAVCGIDRTNAPDDLFVSDAEAIVPTDEKNADFGERLPVLVTNVATGAQVLDLDDMVIEPNPPLRAAYDTNGDAVNDSDFQPGAGVIVTDFNNPDRGAACGWVRAVDLGGTDVAVEIVTAPLKAVAMGTTPRLVAIPAHHYTVNNQLQLVRDGVLLAEGVEDLQVAYFFDENDNDVEDPGEYYGNGVGADYLASDAGARDESTIREVTVNLVFRTRTPDVDNTQGQFQATLNRVPVAAADGFRRRVHTAMVMLRNVGRR